MSDLALNGAVELALPARQSMMLVLRLTTAGVAARAGLGVDRMDDVKLAVEEACGCFIAASGGPSRLHLRFALLDGALRITVRGEDGDFVRMDADEREVVRCILEALADGVEMLSTDGALLQIALRVELGPNERE